MKIHTTSGRTQRGVTLLEVLIALVVLSIGLLGLAALQTTSLQFNHSAQMRSVATQLAYDLADRMRANRQSALNGEYDILATFGTAPDCAAGGGAGTVATIDISEWLASLGCALPTGNGSMRRAGDVITIIVQWDDSRGQGLVVEQFEMTTRL